MRARKPTPSRLRNSLPPAERMVAATTCQWSPIISGGSATFSACALATIKANPNATTSIPKVCMMARFGGYLGRKRMLAPQGPAPGTLAVAWASAGGCCAGRLEARALLSTPSHCHRRGGRSAARARREPATIHQPVVRHPPRSDAHGPAGSEGGLAQPASRHSGEETALLSVHARKNSEQPPQFPLRPPRPATHCPSLEAWCCCCWYCS